MLPFNPMFFSRNRLILDNHSYSVGDIPLNTQHVIHKTIYIRDILFMHFFFLEELTPCLKGKDSSLGSLHIELVDIQSLR